MPLLDLPCKIAHGIGQLLFAPVQVTDYGVAGMRDRLVDIGAKIIIIVQWHSSLIIIYRAHTAKIVSLAKLAIAVSVNDPPQQLQLRFVRPF